MDLNDLKPGVRVRYRYKSPTGGKEQILTGKVLMARNVRAIVSVVRKKRRKRVSWHPEYRDCPEVRIQRDGRRDWCDVVHPSRVLEILEDDQ